MCTYAKLFKKNILKKTLVLSEIQTSTTPKISEMYNPSTTTANFFYVYYHSKGLYKLKAIHFWLYQGVPESLFTCVCMLICKLSTDRTAYESDRKTFGALRPR
jgi:hypothetical protein